MEKSAAAALTFVQVCVEQAEAGDDTVLDIRTHFRDRMRERSLFWSDVLAIIFDPDAVESRGMDDADRQQIWITGTASDGGVNRIVCSIDWDTRLITLNWN